MLAVVNAQFSRKIQCFGFFFNFSETYNSLCIQSYLIRQLTFISKNRLVSRCERQTISVLHPSVEINLYTKYNQERILHLLDIKNWFIRINRVCHHCVSRHATASVSCSANCTREESVGDFRSELSFVSCTTLHVGLCLFLESIEHDFIKALMIHTDNQIVA